MLGLNPESFGKNLKFNFYDHALPASGVYADGLPFSNELRLPNGTSLNFFDYCWTPSTLQNMLNQNGFSGVDIVSVGIGLEGKAGKVLRTSIEKVALMHNVSWKDEWDQNAGPLYQLIIGTREGL